MIRYCFLFFLGTIPSFGHVFDEMYIVDAEQLSCTETQKYALSTYFKQDLFKENLQNIPPDFANQSILATGDIFKLEIMEDGVYKLDYQFLTTFLDLNGVSFSQIKLYGHPGGALPEDVDASGPDDLVEIATFKTNADSDQFNTDDYILFYAQGPDRTHFNADLTISKELNVYARSSYIYLKLSSDNGMSIPQQANVDVDQYSTTKDALISIEENTINLLGSNGSTQGSGQRWFGRIFTKQRSFNLSNELPLAHIDLDQPVSVDMAFAGRSEEFSEIELNIDNTRFTSVLGRVNTGDVEATYARIANISETLRLTSSAPEIEINFPLNSSASEGWLDYFNIQYKQKLVFEGDELVISDFNSLSLPSYGFSIQSTINNPIIWEITNPMIPLEQDYLQSNSSIKFGFESSQLRQFVVFDQNRVSKTPIFIGAIPNQNIHGMDEADLVIVYHQDFEDAADQLAQHRREHDGLLVNTVSIESIYNEFSAGKQDPSAIRNFSKMMFDRHPRFNFLLLLGDGSYDYLGVSEGLSNQSFIPAYQTKESLNPLSAFPTDDYYSLLSDNEGGNLKGALDIAVGRIPVKTTAEANAVIAKIISYDTNPDRFGDWRLRVAFAADDEDSNIHLRQADGIAQQAIQKHPEFNQEKIYFDSYIQESTPGGARYPAANEKLNNEIFNGLLVTNYLGHGGPKGWSQERVLKVADIIDWKNSTKLPLIITATCSFTGFDDPAIVTAGEEAILNPFGGAVALFSTVRSVYSSQNERLTKSVFDTIFSKVDGEYMAIGEILRRSKNANSADTTNINARKFLLIGDPSMKLALPQYNIKTTSVNNKLVGQLSDTLSALQEVLITGEIVTDSGERVTSFTGEIYPTVFDKKSSLSTLANDGTSRVREFEVQRNRLFKGAATVDKGQFSFSFTVPIDIDYTVGKGKLSYYATDGIEMDAAGYSDDILIGGSGVASSLDDSPPMVEAFLNSFEFNSGDETNGDPILLVKLADDKGINFSGISIGHDITAIIDDNTQNTFILNEFYISDLDNAMTGTVRFPLSGLEPGPHTLTVKAFDVANNPGEQTIDFVVIGPEEGEITNLSSFPNPTDGVTTFSFTHNFVNESVETTVSIYNLSGQLVRTLQQSEVLQSSLNQSMTWDGIDDFGSEVVSGIYLYTVKINSPSLNISKESTFEKVVVIK